MVYSKLVLKVLTPEQKKELVFIAETFLNDCEADPTLVRWIITGDEAWVFEYETSTKRQSVQWKRRNEPQHKKVRMARSQQKLMLILFFDVQGMAMAQLAPYRENVDAALYSEMLWKLRICIRKTWPENLFVLHHNNARSHWSDSTQKFPEKNNMWLMPHPYSPDFAPCDFFIFPKLKLTPKG